MAGSRHLPVVAALGTAQTLAWASTYYLPAMLAVPMAKDLGVSTPMVFAAFSMALIVSALLGPYAVLLATVFAATWFISTAMAAHLPRLLQASGATLTTAVAVGALIGPAQVAGRLLEFGTLRRLHPLLSARLAALMHPIGASLLLSGPVGRWRAVGVWGARPAGLRCAVRHAEAVRPTCARFESGHPINLVVKHEHPSRHSFRCRGHHVHLCAHRREHEHLV